jgi:feruloyl esterase
MYNLCKWRGRIVHTRTNWILAGALAVSATMTSHAVLAAQSCADLAKPGLFRNTVVQTAKDVRADSKSGMPSFCEVTAVITPVPRSRITAVYRLPEPWNGRLLGLGGAGWAGLLYLSVPHYGPGRLADLGLPRGYATAQTDGGHPTSTIPDISSTTDISWVRDNPEAITDFSFRAIHVMTLLGKQVVARYYGRRPDKSYYQGCSSGGRMGMMETQRYPEDYDGVVAGAPVNSLMVQASSVWRDQIFKAPGAAISDEQLKLVHEAVLKACDAADGLKDGIITDPRRCSWDPVILQCKSETISNDCLAPPQVEALRKAYSTIRTRTGAIAYYGLMPGSEAGWNPTVSTTPGPRNVMNGDLGELVPLIFGDPNFDPTKVDLDRQVEVIHRTPFAAEYEAGSTSLSKFFGRGGKLLLYHGFDDPAPSALATIDYYDRAVKENGASNLRLFVVPGVYHCAIGPGTDTFDPLTAMEQWVENGKAPETMIAKNERTGIERPICAWPKLPYYRSGNPAKATSFECR